MESPAERYLSAAADLLTSRAKRLKKLVEAGEEQWPKPAEDCELDPAAIEGLLFLMGFHEFKAALESWRTLFRGVRSRFPRKAGSLASLADKLIEFRPVRVAAQTYVVRLSGSAASSLLLDERPLVDPSEHADRIVDLHRLREVAQAAMKADAVCYDPGWDSIKSLCDQGLTGYEILLKDPLRMTFRTATGWHLSNYAGSVFLRSWFSRTPLCERLIIPSQFHSQTMRLSNQLENILREIRENSPSNEVPFGFNDAVQVLDSVEAALRDAASYADLAETLASGHGLAGCGNINQIPGVPGTACHQILLALSTGGGDVDPLSFETILRDVRIHMWRCQKVTRLVLFFADVWDNSLFTTKLLPELKAAAAATGAVFVFFLASGSGGRPSLIEVVQG